MQQQKAEVKNESGKIKMCSRKGQIPMSAKGECGKENETRGRQKIDSL